MDRQAPKRGLTPAVRQPVALGVAITVYAAWNAHNLISAWRHSPFDRCDSLAFALWIVPLACLWSTRLLAGRIGPVASAAFAIALILSFAGAVMDLSVLEYAGLAIALAGFLPLQPATFLWLICAAAWMPAAGWAFSSHGSFVVNSMRAAVGLAAALLTPFFLHDEPVC